MPLKVYAVVMLLMVPCLYFFRRRRELHYARQMMNDEDFSRYEAEHAEVPFRLSFVEIIAIAWSFLFCAVAFVGGV